MSSPNTYVKRTTLFKVPEADIDLVLTQYETLRQTAKKDDQDGKPYIVSNTARRILNTSSPLSDGYTIASQSIFKNKEDHEFYDQNCEAHKTLKEVTGKVRKGIMTVVTEGEWPEAKL